MNSAESNPQFKDQDDLRLLALSRIPRCAACSRLRALKQTHDNGAPLEAPLPPIPDGCDTPYCAPLAARYALEERRGASALRILRGTSRRAGASTFVAVAPAQ